MALETKIFLVNNMKVIDPVKLPWVNVGSNNNRVLVREPRAVSKSVGNTYSLGPRFKSHFSASVEGGLIFVVKTYKLDYTVKTCKNELNLIK